MAEKFPPLWSSKSSDSAEDSNEENLEAPFPNYPQGLFERSTRDGCNYAYESSPDDENEQRPSCNFHLRGPLRQNAEARRFHSRDEDNARADFMAVSRKPEYQRSLSDGFYCVSEDAYKRTFVMPSSSRPTTSNPLIDETSINIELAEMQMSGATGGDATSGIQAKRVFAPNRYEESRISHQRISSQLEASGSRDKVDSSKSARSSTLSNATTVSDDQRKNRVTITPFLDEYFRNRATAIIAENPAASDRANLIDNEETQDDPHEDAAAAPQRTGLMATYYNCTNIIINSYFIFIVYIPLTCLSSYNIYEGVKYMKICPSTDTIPIIFVFLGLTSLIASIARMLHIVIRRFTSAYPLIINILQCLEGVMCLGYSIIYFLELASIFFLQLQSLPEVCVTNFYDFAYWNTWFQMPIIALVIFLHAPSAYRSKWCCISAERS